MNEHTKVDTCNNVDGEIRILLESDKEDPMMILINTNAAEQKVFKGYIYTETKTFKNVQLSEREKADIERDLGEVTQVEFQEFRRLTAFKDNMRLKLYIEFLEYKRINKEAKFNTGYESFTEVKDGGDINERITQ